MYQSPPPNTTVLCLDEMGVIGARTYPTTRLTPKGQRPPVAPDYGGRGYTWVFGAFEPATGQVLTRTAHRRDTAAFLDLLDQLIHTWPVGDLVLILDNLSIHKTLDVRLWALAHPRVAFLFMPTYSPWLNLIEPWWKTLRALALKGRCFDEVAQLRSALELATAYWNNHPKPYHWRKSA
ncbi:MAG: hypothetical protein BroJett018_21900 [Chloroflexota bacterium]|nr:IS630 family transposase [Chloroflexota bacterium]NOG65481.1 IS630 family transposase [Chloroflexota bacterium]GIK64396.1 MAG: hypothetical protein BroJett018_21900 [Chloroflexota bacterium]